MQIGDQVAGPGGDQAGDAGGGAMAKVETGRAEGLSGVRRRVGAACPAMMVHVHETGHKILPVKVVTLARGRTASHVGDAVVLDGDPAGAYLAGQHDPGVRECDAHAAKDHRWSIAEVQAPASRTSFLGNYLRTKTH